MTPTDFQAMLESVLQHQRGAAESDALMAFVEAAWPWIDDFPDVDEWADRFCDSGAVTTLC